MMGTPIKAIATSSNLDSVHSCHPISIQFASKCMIDKTIYILVHSMATMPFLLNKLYVPTFNIRMSRDKAFLQNSTSVQRTFRSACALIRVFAAGVPFASWAHMQYCRKCHGPVYMINLHRKQKQCLSHERICIQHTYYYFWKDAKRDLSSYTLIKL